MSSTSPITASDDATPIIFAPTYSSTSTDVRLLELPPDLLALLDSLTPAAPLVIRAPSPTSHATLHTADRTYLLREVHTSNTVLVCDRAPHEWTVRASTGTYLEAVPSAPPRAAEILSEVLQASGYDGDEATMDVDGRPRVTMDALLNAVPASLAELHALLRRMHAVELDGEIRVLEHKYVKDMLTVIVSTAVIEGWDLARMRFRATVDAAHEYDDIPEPVVRHLLCAFAVDEGGPVNADVADDFEVALSPSKLVAHFAECVLSEVGSLGSMSYSEFETKWIESVPEPLTIDPAAIEPFSMISDNRIFYLPPSQLPGTVPDRLRALFAIREHWPRELLIARVRDLAPADTAKAAEQMLLKHARLVKADGSVYFAARRDMKTRR
ncbi:hypothetical protein AMAG_07860 [Allomyces macrogynus ATCC 38327]|uniref:Sister chromatid cohesion protein DCC1 n=1 Tax=Allomyces macrogynus (strain ATCC 38327) TaxID=578462 RepID=A0A0L0SJK6_ALLM3|nr:hypothetical protein AMAG_07860 [Allomyces macrogynus ATCC 38327]|eukprot:KNE62667.1 hypothetical protein AMAG_07860 [Allomyces macrogynus ATCC 38327]